MEANVLKKRPVLQSNMNNKMENLFYQISVDPESGGIRSIIDKELNKEIVNQNSPFQLNQYIYDRYTTAPRFNHLSSRVIASADQLLGNRSTANLAKVYPGESNSIYQSIKVVLQAPGCEWIEQEIFLYKSIKRIDIVNRLMKKETDQKEAVYFSYPFSVPNGKMRYEITGDYVSPDDPHIPGSCHYMKAIQHWLSVSNSEFTVLWGTLEAPLIEVGNIHIPYNPFDSTLPAEEPETVYSYAINNIWDTNFPHQQGGEVIFHTSITSHASDFDPIRAYQFGTEVQNPLSGLTIPHKASKPADSWLEMDSNKIQVFGIRQITNGRFLLLLQGIDSEEKEVNLSSSSIIISSAYTSNIVGGNLKPITVKDGIISIKIKGKALQAIVIETE